MRRSMKLRKARKAPKRFDDYEWEQEEEDRELRATATSPKARPRSAIRNRRHNLPSNPSLPPAAFPSLESDVARKANFMAARSPHAKSLESDVARKANFMAEGSPHAQSLVINTKIQSHIEWLKNNKIKSVKAERARIPIPPPYTTPSSIQPGSMYDKLGQMRTERETAEMIHYQNQLNDERFARNMEILDRMARRTSDDWNIREMMTSDEEESSPVISSQSQKVRHTVFQSSSHSLIGCQPTPASTSTLKATAFAASWDKLSIAHQLDLVLTLFEIYGTVTEAMQQLHLDKFQSQNMLQFIERYPESEIDEAKCLSELEVGKIPIKLLPDSDGGDQKDSRWVCVEKLTLSTTKELAKAKAYLESCGKKPTLLDHWKSLLYEHGSSCDENCQKLESSLSPPAEAEKVRSCLTPQPEKPTCEHISRLCVAPSSQKPLYKTSHSPITFLYPLPPGSSPPPRKLAKVDGKKIAQKSYPAVERHYSMHTSQGVMASPRHDIISASSSVESIDSNFSPTISTFSSATSTFSSTSPSLEPKNKRNGRSDGPIGSKYKPVASQRKLRAVSSSSSKCVDPIRRLLS